PGIALAGPALPDRDGDLDGQLRRAPRQPLELDAARVGRAVSPWEPNRELVAEAEDRVDRAARLDPAQRQVAPLRELLGDETPHERLLELELVLVHAPHPANTRGGGRRRIIGGCRPSSPSWRRCRGPSSSGSNASGYENGSASSSKLCRSNRSASNRSYETPIHSASSRRRSRNASASMRPPAPAARRRSSPTPE